MSAALPSASFARLGPACASTPLVIAVPHAGRCYPPDLLAAARLPRPALETLEDAFADRLIEGAVALGAVAIVARMARAFADLNRAEDELDPTMLDGPRLTAPALLTPKVLGGLGVIPSRIAAGGQVWRRPLAPSEIEARLAFAHRPYHRAIAAALDQAAAVHGIAVLIDCHSMPNLGRGSAQIVIGDRHGGSAGAAFTGAALAAAQAAGFRVARNQPYAGGHSLARHGAPKRGRHAVQVEIDRDLYLDPARRALLPGFTPARDLVTQIAAALIDCAKLGEAAAAE